jgi:hypothetical protein
MGTINVYCGNQGVTTATGMPLIGVVGASMTIPTTAAVYYITASSNQNIALLENF